MKIKINEGKEEIEVNNLNQSDKYCSYSTLICVSLSFPVKSH